MAIATPGFQPLPTHLLQPGNVRDPFSGFPHWVDSLLLRKSESATYKSEHLYYIQCCKLLIAESFFIYSDSSANNPVLVIFKFNFIKVYAEGS